MANRTRIVVSLLVVLAPWVVHAAAPRTFRVDYFHSGTDKTEDFSVDRLVLEPLPFPGNPNRLIDDSGLGKYLFEVRDEASDALLYSRGFASIYGEWETTDEARTTRRTFHESIRFPAPTQPVKVVLRKRDEAQAFKPVWTLTVDPADVFVDHSRPPDAGPLIALQKSGAPTKKLDLLIIGDGYTAKERKKFERDAKRMIEVLFSYAPFKERRKDFNVWGLCPPAAESGVSRPSSGIHRRSPVGATYDAFGSERYVLTFDNRAFRDVASQAPYDAVEILVNQKTYGGGGIFNLYGTVAADSAWAEYVFVHELGHHLAALADEYYTSETAYLASPDRLEPWEPNVTALKDPKKLKWRDLVKSATPLPTPWDKETFEAQARVIQERRKKIRSEGRPEAEMDALFREQRDLEEKLLGKERFATEVGAFEGANYESNGYFRPQADCVMFTRNRVPFCHVCQRGISRVIDLYTR